MSNKEPVTRGSEDARDWAAELAERMGSAVSEKRRAEGLSAVQLSERTAELGYPITRGTIAKIEGGHRSGKFDVAELFVLAQALRIPPVLLLFPQMPDGALALNPATEEVSSHQALRWFTGESNIHGFSSEDSLRLMILVRRYVELRREFAPALVRARDRPQDKDFEQALADVELRLSEIAEQLHIRGATVHAAPELHPLGSSLEADRRLYDTDEPHA